MAKTRKVLSDAELIAYSKEHVYYEIQMLCGCLQLLMANLQSPSQALVGVMRNALLESFAIHLRNLVDFLYPNTVKDSDVLADDFFPHAKRPGAFPALPVNLADARKRAHKQVSHLTTGRLDAGDPGKNWSVHALTREVLAVLVEFSRLASPGKLDSSVRDYISQISKALP